MNVVKDIQPLSLFKRKSASFVKQAKQTGDPIILTINGKPELVVLTAQAYQSMVEEQERTATIAAVKRGLEEMQHGAGTPENEFWEEFFEKNGISETE